MVISPRFELFFALAAVLEPATPDPPDEAAARWLAQARRKVDQGFRRRLGSLATPEIWRDLAQRLGARALDDETDAVIEALGALEPAAVDILRRFDRMAFAAFWRVARARFAAAESLVLHDSRTRDDTVHFPSWFAPAGSAIILEAPGGRRIEARFFSPQEMPPVLERAAPPGVTTHPTAADPALVFHALGDATRYAIASLLARDALTSAELARRLGVATPTLAHHLRALRQARLVLEEKRGNSILLRLNRDTVAGLSAATVSALYDPAQPVPLRRSRRAQSPSL